MSRAVALQSDRLSDLELRQSALKQKIAVEKRKLLDQSRGRAAVRTRVIGETMMKMREQGRLSDGVLQEIKEALLAHVEGKDAEFESLQGTAFDVTDLLHETSQAVTSCSEAEPEA
jgi:hypothetical protein